MAIIEGVHNNLKKLIKATSDGELEVRAIIESELEHASASGKAFIWMSTNSDIGAGDTRLFIKNTSDKFLVLSRMLINPANVVCRYDVGLGALTTTPTGTPITAGNPNEIHSTTQESYVAFDNETAVADTTPMMTVVGNTTSTILIPMDGYILGKNHYTQVNQMTESTSGQIIIVGHFEDELV